MFPCLSICLCNPVCLYKIYSIRGILNCSDGKRVRLCNKTADVGVTPTGNACLGIKWAGYGLAYLGKLRRASCAYWQDEGCGICPKHGPPAALPLMRVMGMVRVAPCGWTTSKWRLCTTIAAVVEEDHIITHRYDRLYYFAACHDLFVWFTR